MAQATQEFETIFDPRNDGWDTEVFNSQAGTQLSHLGHAIEEPSHLSADSLAEVCSPQFACDSLRPAATESAYADRVFQVERSPWQGSPERSEGDEAFQGPGGLAEALRLALGPLAEGERLHCKFKLFHVTPAQGYIETTQYFSVSGEVAGQVIEQTSTWVMHWTKASGEELPKLLWIGQAAFEEVTADQEGGFVFADCTQAVVGETEAFQEQLGYSLDYWRMRVERQLGLEFNAQHGLTVGDANGDGLEDVYICQPGALPNRLFLQNADGTVRDHSHAAGVDIMNFTQSALFLDLDNDGDQDLVVSTNQGVFLLANDGNARFERKATFPTPLAATSLAAADFDQDGDLDIYFCAYDNEYDDPTIFPSPTPFQDANNGGRNHLIRNEGNWVFHDATVESGLDENNNRWSFAASWEDYDQDGDEDLYVANDFGRNCLYQNNNGYFTDVAAEANLEDGAFGMSVSWGDYNNDGLMDIYVGNMFSAAGNRVTYQHRFRPGESQEMIAQLRRLARGNSLFQNMGDGTFTDVSVEAGVTMGRWSWASLFSDINNDGWEDLLVANGYFTSTRNDDL